MDVILRQDVPSLGKAGDAVTVKDGYARNYLLPRNLAVVATKGTLKQRETVQAAKQSKEERLFAEAEKNADAIRDKILVFEAKSGQGRIFGSVTPQDIASEISKRYGVRVDKRRVLLKENLKELGQHEVIVQLHPKIKVKVIAEIRAEGGK